MREKGFTLFEIVIVLAIMAILAAIAVPVIYHQFTIGREVAVKETMEKLKEAMIGDPDLKSNGVRTDFGYLGDWGSLPATLDDLFFAQTPLWSFDAAKKVGAGWNGPYLTGTFSEDSTWFKIDGWNNEYVYSTVDYVNGEGNVVDGKIVSPGPDKSIGTADDFIIKILKIETTSTVYVYVYDSDGNPMQNIPITIYYPQNGIITQNTVLSDASGLYTFNSIPFGVRSIYIEPKLVYVVNSAIAWDEGKNHHIEFQIINYSANDITITSLKAEYSSTPTSYYSMIKINNTPVWTGSSPRLGSGDTATFAPVVVEASGLVRTPYTVYVGSPTVRVPDVTIYTAGGPNIVTIQLKQFVDSITGGGNPVGVSGVPFKITFSDGSIVSFVPVPTKE